MQADLSVILPEILISAFALITLLGVAYTGKDRFAVPLLWATAALFVLMAAWIGLTGEGTRTAGNGMVNDAGVARVG